MTYDASYLWLWLALAALIGVAVGWGTEGPEPQQPWFQGWVRGALIALVIALLAAVIGVFGGRLAFWLETAVLFAIAYVVGCLVGGALKRLRRV